jgi:hypothetical protein
MDVGMHAAFLSAGVTPPSCRNRRGVTLIEAVLFISVAIALIVAGLRFYEQAERSSTISHNTRLLNALVTEMRDANMRNGVVVRWQERDADGNVVWRWPDVANYLIESGAVPGPSIGEDGLIHDRRGRPMPIYVGTVLIEPTSTYLGPGYIAGFDGEISVAECTRMTAVDARGSGRVGHGITQILIYRDTEDGDQMEFLTSPPFSPSDASEKCAEAFGINGVDDALLMFTFAP